MVDISVLFNRAILPCAGLYDNAPYRLYLYMEIPQLSLRRTWDVSGVLPQLLCELLPHVLASHIMQQAPNDSAKNWDLV